MQKILVENPQIVSLFFSISSKPEKTVCKTVYSPPSFYYTKTMF